MRPDPPVVAPPAAGQRRYRAVVAYDGSAFHGFAPNPGVPTVGGALTQSLARVVGHEIELVCAGRTDRGVHGWGQVVSFDAPSGMDLDAMMRSVNKMCAPAIVVRALGVAEDDFDARFSARSRTYRYVVLHRAVPDPFLYRTSWHVPHDLDIESMNRAGRDLIGEHDFSSFCRKRKVRVAGKEIEASLVREILSIEWRPANADLVELWVTASAFCHQMVRALTGTLVDVGLGKTSPDAMPAIIAAADRSAAGRLAPPQGLTLWEVGY